MNVRQVPHMVRALPATAPVTPLLAVIGAAVAAVVHAGADGPAATARFRMGGALVAASTGFVLDDTAAVTLASSPTTLAARRAVRAATSIVTVVCWWVAMAAYVDARTGRAVTFGGGLLELVTLALVSLGVSAWAARVSDDGTGGMAGAGAALVCFGTAHLPPRWWWPMSADTGSPGALRRLAVTLLVAVGVLAIASRDPARRPPAVRRS
jgi:hypothetical protein